MESLVLRSIHTGDFVAIVFMVGNGTNVIRLKHLHSGVILFLMISIPNVCPNGIRASFFPLLS